MRLAIYVAILAAAVVLVLPGSRAARAVEAVTGSISSALRS